MRSPEARILLAAEFVESSFAPLGHRTACASAVDSLMRRGYLRVQPNDIRFSRDTFDRLRALRVRELLHRDAMGPSSLGGFLFGDPGRGKSVSLAQILKTYPQVITHRFSEQHEAPFKQVTYLNVLVPPTGSLKALCTRFVRAMDDTLGTNYAVAEKIHAKTALQVEDLMAELALSHALGLLVLDDVHHLQPGPSGGKYALKDSLAQFTDKLGIPIFLIGIPRAEDLLKSEPYLARRFSAFTLRWEALSVVRPPTKATSKAQLSEWELYARSIWEAATTLRTQPLGAAELEEWYKKSSGNIHRANELFIQSVRTGIVGRSECVDAPLFPSSDPRWTPNSETRDS